MGKDFLLGNISITNFRMIKEMQLAFKPGINLLIGDNGAGKTTILEALTVALGGFLAGIEDVSTRNIKKQDIHYDLYVDSTNTANKAYRYPVTIASDVLCSDKKVSWTRTRKDGNSNSKTITSPREILKYAQELVNSKIETMWPLISYVSASRHWVTKRSDANEKTKKKLHDRRCAYLDCLESRINMQAIFDWCESMEYVLFKGGKAANYKEFCQIVSKFMSYINDDKKCEIYYDIAYGGCVYREDGKLKDINDLSAGYQSILNIIIDLAYRAAILNPEAGSKIADTAGVVLIDELDTNLHPRWQWLVVDALIKTFPNVQFIAATHSPIIISSCKNAHIIRMEEGQEPVVDSDCYGYTVNDVLRFTFNKNERPKEIEKCFSNFHKFLDDENFPQAKVYLREAEKLLGEEHPLVVTMQTEFNLEAME